LKRTLASRRVSFFVVGIVLAAGYVATHYHGWLYRGPQLIDHGMFSQPRYEAVFGDIPLNATGKYSYTFSRFPAAEAMIMLLTPDRPPLEAIQNLDTELHLRMVGQDGTVHCEGAGSLRDRLPEGLKISSSDRVDGVSHDSCGWLRLRGCNPCRLEVSISRVDATTPNVRLVVTVSGGGLEIP
jgi:hypothetical protein